MSGHPNQDWLHPINRVSEREGGKAEEDAVGAPCQYATPITDAVLIARQQTHDRVPCAHSLLTCMRTRGVVTYHVNGARRQLPLCPAPPLCAPRRNPHQCTHLVYMHTHLGFSDDKSMIAHAVVAIVGSGKTPYSAGASQA